jgi:hypothetical protein
MTVEDVIRAHTEGFNRALTTHDLDALSAIYADDYMLVRMTLRVAAVCPPADLRARGVVGRRRNCPEWPNRAAAAGTWISRYFLCPVAMES